ncbi:tRNA glutamyl-Q(34) synthetase GluQRS [Vineibacter terrae]|uniref:tRNA glutamyl-Q(34) synthetase GluQRS n=1 Tax=Vineibacter terrae TaxID=2586908 RepID=A0A5C8PB96_9HYPH|nr:tRNA glutamyl-Q(34) synthetase GluQRS [Vineibacter terrae]
MPLPLITRFAPSPTGYLHLGHAFSALTAWHRARDAGGRFLLRIEDIDIRRCKPEFEAAILDDLAWLGLDWDGDVRRQSDHFADYGAALDRLQDMGVVYPCFCTRADIAREIAAAQSAPHGPDGPLYPGTCRGLAPAERRARVKAGAEFALRLDCAKAADRAGPYRFFEEGSGWIDGEPGLHGDVVIARKDTPTSYHLAVTVDDHLQGVTLVSRGIDLLPATHVHGLLQRLLGYETPRYAHHRLLTDAQGRRFAKRDQSLTLRALREAGAATADVRKRAGFD